MKKVILLANFMDVGENSNNRFNYIAELLNDKCNLEIVTSTFSHIKKEQRKDSTDKKNIKMLFEPGYKKNISIKRLYSHYILAKNLKKYLKNLTEKPDVIYCAVPSLNFAKVAAKYAKKNNIRFIIDVQDLWPEAFEMIINVKILSNLIFYKMKKTANYIYKQADDIIAVSETYANRVIEVNKKYNNKIVVFLGTDLDKFDKYVEEKKEEKTIKEIVYVGTLGHSYDIISVVDAIYILKKQGIDNIKFVIIGDGPLKEKIKNYAEKKKINFEILGRLEYSKMVKRLSTCDIAVNPISKNAAQSIINKVGDYAAAGLPVINTQECKEYRDIVEKYKIGYNCKNGDSEDIAKGILKMINNSIQMKQFGINNRNLAEEKFNRSKTYLKIVELIK